MLKLRGHIQYVVCAFLKMTCIAVTAPTSTEWMYTVLKGLHLPFHPTFKYYV